MDEGELWRKQEDERLMVGEGEGNKHPSCLSVLFLLVSAEYKKCFHKHFVIMTNKLLFIYRVKSDSNSVCDQKKNPLSSEGEKNSTSLLNGVSNDNQADRDTTDGGGSEQMKNGRRQGMTIKL